MKKSQLKEAIKAEIKSILSEEIQVGDIVTLGGDGDELEVIDKRGMFGSDMMAYRVKFPNGDTAEYSSDQLRPTSMMNEESRFPTQADIDDIENSGNIDIAYDKAMKLLKSLMNKSVSFSDVREGTWSSGTYNEIGRFIQDVKNLKDKYYNIVGNDDVFDGLDRAEESAREMMINAPENRSDLSEGFRDPEDNYGFDESPEYEIDDYEIGDQVVVTRGSSNDLGIVTKVDIPNNLVYVSWNPNRPSDESQAFNPGEVTFPGSPGRLREDEEPTKAELKKKDSVATISNKLQKLTAKMKKKAKEFKEAEGKAKDKIKDELKDMTAEKKKLEKSL